MEKTTRVRPAVESGASFPSIDGRFFSLQDSVAIVKMLCLDRQEGLLLAEEILAAIDSVKNKSVEEAGKMLAEARS